MTMLGRRMRRIWAMAVLAIAVVALGGTGSAGSAMTARSQKVTVAADTDTKAPLPNPYHKITPIAVQPGYAYATGFSDAVKLRGAALLGEPVPSTADEQLDLYVTYELPNLLTCGLLTDSPECSYLDYAAGQLSYDGKAELPPVTETFLAYGFMPVTATLTLSQVGTSNCAAPGQTPVSAPMCVYTDAHSVTGSGQVSIATAQTQVGVSDVKVNGVPLDIGQSCHSSPFKLTLTGSSVGTVFPVAPEIPASGMYVVANGGALTGTADIPAFTGCATADGENLAPLLDASISGPGNYVQITQGNLCEPGLSLKCPAVAQAPQRQVPEFAITEQGGSNTSTVCGQVNHKTVLDSPAGYTDIGTIESFSAGACAVTDGPGANESCTIVGQNLPWSITATSYDPNENVAVGAISSMDLAGQCTVSGGGSCTFTLAGSMDVVYDYSSGIFADIGTPVKTTASTCADFLVPPPGNAWINNIFVPQYAVPSTGASQ